MKTTGMCPKCAGRDIVEVSDIIDQIGTESTGLAQLAYVCSACGFIEFYVQRPEELRDRAAAGRPRGPFR